MSLMTILKMSRILSESLILRISEIVIHKCLCLYVYLIAQLCPTLCDRMDCSSLDSSVLGILQARILKWVAIFLVLWQEKDFCLSFYLILCAVGHPWVKVG